MQRLNKYELRYLINEETKSTQYSQQKLDEGALDYIENLAVTALGHAGFGDAAAAIKAVGPDAYRVGKSAMELNAELEKATNGMLNLVDFFREDIDDSPEMQEALMMISSPGLSQADRDLIKQKLIRLGENTKKLLVSIVSIFPDVVISGSIALVITNMPIEEFLIEAAGVFADMMDKAEESMVGGAMKGFLEFIAKLANGPAGLLFNSPLITFKNMGALANATLNPGVTPFKQLSTSLSSAGVADMAKGFAKDKASDYFNNFSAIDDFDLDASDFQMVAESVKRTSVNQGPSFNEARMLKLAGLK